jgi:spermidine synthase
VNGTAAIRTQPWRIPFAVLLGGLFFISGFTGLLYEVIWAKYLSLLLGSTAYAQVGVLAVFMGGLAAGSVVWGRLVDRSRRPLALYGALEVGIGVCAGAFALGFESLRGAYWSALALAGNAGIVAAALKAGLCIVAMLAPTFCMGGTLPVLARALGLQRGALGRGVAYLYAVNSLGAALGAVTTGFYLVARWGFDAPFLAAAAVNVVVGVIAIALALGGSHSASAVQPEPRDAGGGVLAAAWEVSDVRAYGTLVLVAAAVSGMVAMVYEVAWIRLCSLVLGSSTYSFSVMLTAFITGIAAGSLVYTLTGPARRRPLRFFAYTSLAAALVLLLCLTAYERLPYYLGRLTAFLAQRDASFALYQAATLLFCLAVMLPLTFVSGLNFPALTQAAGQVRAGVGRPVSAVLFANTAGTIIGAVGGGLYVLPAAGLRGTFLLGIAATVSVATAVLVCDRALPRRGVRPLAFGLLAGVAAYAAWAPSWDLRLLVAGEFRNHAGIGADSFAAYRADLPQHILFYRDDASATVSVERGPQGDVVLRVNGKADASAQGDSDTELLSGHLPAVLHPQARHALVIGYGSGITVGALLRHPIESVDVIEISPAVIAADEQFRAYNHDALRDGRTHLFLEDARTFLYRAPRRYDLIVSEPSNPWIAGIGNLFTAEFFAQARSRLTPNGLLVQWFHSYETSDALVALVLRTVSAGFAEVRVFQPNRWDLLIVASPTRRAVSRAAMQEAFGYAGDVQSLGITRLSTLLALEVLPDALVRQVAGKGALNRDRMPLLEYVAPRAFFAGANAELLADVRNLEADGYLQSVADLSLDDYREMAAFIQRADLLHYNQVLRLLAAWLARAPNDRAALQFLSRWMTARPNSPLLMPALVHAAADVDPARQRDYAAALLRIVWSTRINPDARDVAAIVPAVQAAAQRSADGVSLLKEIGDLYLAARAYGPAVESFDIALMHAPDADHGGVRAALHCGRGVGLEKLGKLAAARQAFQLCLQEDASNAAAAAALQRLDAAGGQR